MSSPVVVWFRQDLRLADNPALAAAAEGGCPVLPVYVLDEATPGRWSPGGASRWWLHQALAALAGSLERLGAPLLLRRGPADRAIPDLVAETGATAVHWNRCYEPYAIARDRALKRHLAERGIAATSHNAGLLFEPWTVKTGAGDPYRVFSPFWKAIRARGAPPAPLPAPQRLEGVGGVPGETLEDFELLPTRPDWAGGLRENWRPGEAGAADRLAAFLATALPGYGGRRDRPDVEGTSRLSPHLHFGEIGPRQVWHAVAAAAARDDAAAGPSADGYLRELGWREFSHHLLFHYPDLPEHNWRAEFDGFPWRGDDRALEAWRRGRTGFPIVDAGMRELWHTGWMHNRVRMIAASFLVKDLLLDWRSGEDWFWDTLVDADLANNAASWQWVAGSGADAAPYFRIFNPELQSRRFDPAGAYIRRWVPELAGLPDELVHAPAAAPAAVLARCGVSLGDTYPRPIVDHGAARRRALEAFASIRQGAA